MEQGIFIQRMNLMTHGRTSHMRSLYFCSSLFKQLTTARSISLILSLTMNHIPMSFEFSEILSHSAIQQTRTNESYLRITFWFCVTFFWNDPLILHFIFVKIKNFVKNKKRKSERMELKRSRAKASWKNLVGYKSPYVHRYCTYRIGVRPQF
jgi:hypothetical protein